MSFVDIIFEIECELCNELFIDEFECNVCEDCKISRRLPVRKIDREKGEKYWSKHEIVIWGGKVLHCKHDKRKSQCKECGGISICEHNRQRSQCKECDGVSICEHNRQRSKCKECGGVSICEHKRERSQCKECGGASICEHDRRRSKCKECGGVSICIHKKHKSTCLECFSHPQNFCSICESVYTKNSPYRPLCYRCYCYTNPDGNIPRRYKMKENYVHDYLISKLSQYKIIHDKSVSGGCSRKQPDWLIDMFTHSVIIENDEDQHKNYSCENKRMMELFTDLGSRPLVMIRFNCDKYHSRPSCFEFDKKNVIIPTSEWESRRDVLIKSIIYNCENIPTKEISIDYLFYND